MEILDLKQAREQGKEKYFTGKPCLKGHISERYTTNRTCLSCSHKQAVAWMNNNKEHQLTKRRACYAKNPEKHSIRFREWSKNNRHKLSIKELKRYEYIKNATPKWLTKEHYNQMESIYWLSKLQQELTDTKYHVDHIVPLQGKTVCGLNVPWNLQVFEAKENIRKSNHFNEWAI